MFKGFSKEIYEYKLVQFITPANYFVMRKKI